MNAANLSWQQALRNYLDKRAIILTFLGFSAGLPLLLVFSSLSLWMREAGVERSTVTMFSWAALAYSFKFVWAPLVDSLPLPFLLARLGRRRSWLMAAQVMIMLSIVLMALQNPAKPQELVWMAVFTVLLGFSAATQDIVIDAYRIECAELRLQSALSSWYIAGYRFGMIWAGAGSLYLASFLGTSSDHYVYSAWRYTYWCMAAFMLLGIVTTGLMPEPKRAVPAVNGQKQAPLLILFVALVSVFVLVFWQLGAHLSSASPFLAFVLQLLRLAAAILAAALLAYVLIKLRWVDKTLVYATWLEPLADFFQRYGKQAALLLLLIGLYRISDIVAGVISNVFYQDLGFSKDDIATAVKTVGVLMSILGGFIGGLLAQRYRVMNMLMVGAFLACVSNLLFVLLAQQGHDFFYFYLAVVADNLAAGLASAIFVAFLSALTSIRFTAVQYAISSSLMTLIPKTIGGYSGAIVDKIGYGDFFIISFLLGLPVLLLVYYLAKTLVLDKG